jgi:hypothetical protein
MATAATSTANPLTTTVLVPDLALFFPLMLVPSSLDGAGVCCTGPSVCTAVVDGATVEAVVGATVLDGHTLQTGHPVRLFAELAPHGHGAQVGSGVCCTGGSVVGAAVDGAFVVGAAVEGEVVLVGH